MGHTNQTANYNLPQFVGTDKPSWLGDINDAFAAIDTAIAAAASEASTADGKADALGTTVSGHTTQIGTLQNTVTSQGNTLNTVTSLIGNGEPTTQDKTIIGAINELAAEIPAGGESVRYHEGYIQYSTDGGTTWINLINVSTPVQLLPVMTGSSAAEGEVTTSGNVSGNAYRAIDGSDISSNAPYITSQNGAIIFTFTNLQYVNSLSAKVYAVAADHAQLSARLDYSTDGVNWTNGEGVTVPANDLTVHDVSTPVNNTIKALRVIRTGASGDTYVKQIEAWN